MLTPASIRGLQHGMHTWLAAGPAVAGPRPRMSRPVRHAAKRGVVEKMRCQICRRSPSASAFQFAAALLPELSQQQLLPPTPYAAAPPSLQPGGSTPAFHPSHPAGSPSTAELLRAAHSGSTTAQLSRQLAHAYPRRAVTFAPPACARTCLHAALAPSQAVIIQPACRAAVTLSSTPAMLASPRMRALWTRNILGACMLIAWVLPEQALRAAPPRRRRASPCSSPTLPRLLSPPLPPGSRPHAFPHLHLPRPRQALLLRSRIILGCMTTCTDMLRTVTCHHASNADSRVLACKKQFFGLIILLERSRWMHPLAQRLRRRTALGLRPTRSWRLIWQLRRALTPPQGRQSDRARGVRPCAPAAALLMPRRAPPSRLASPAGPPACCRPPLSPQCTPSSSLCNCCEHLGAARSIAAASHCCMHSCTGRRRSRERSRGSAYIGAAALAAAVQQRAARTAAGRQVRRVPRRAVKPEPRAQLQRRRQQPGRRACSSILRSPWRHLCQRNQQQDPAGSLGGLSHAQLEGAAAQQ